ncbi:long-chain fatty acid--CoA ligase [Actinoplanes sp. NPDC049668]|uniref:acyl-CoA synthetase n=1 Tax=Actinoplanes sp. NPDC049668 TaxID=3363904 RepID=UPI003798114C
MLGSWPARRAAMSPRRTALIFEDRRTTYAELHARTARLAGALRGAGVRRGDRVAYLGPNHPAFVETMFAAYALGAVFVPLNYRLTAPELDHQLRHSGTTALIVAPGMPPVSVGTTVHLTAYEEFLSSGGPVLAAEPAGIDEVACILYTSGTTGTPKGATLTHANIVWNCYNLLVGVDVISDDVALISAPLFHVAALNQCLLPALLKGGTSVIMPSWDPDDCLDLIGRHGVTWMFGVSTMFARLTGSPRWDTADLSSVRVLLTGGAPVPEALIRRYQERGLAFCQGYGMTETAPGATFLEARESREHLGSAGPPVFFADVRCVRPDLTDTEPGEPGEVLVRGPNVTPGYWNDPAATAAAFVDGDWFRSGDVATVDADGHFRIVDRTKDMYISGGENVYPAEVEAAIFEHPAVAEAAVVGVPDERWGEVGRAFVVPAPGRHLTPGEVPAFLRSRLAGYKIPAYVDVVDDLPRTGSNKVRKGDLRALPLPKRN